MLPPPTTQPMATGDYSAHPYRIETARRAVALTMPGGEVLRGHVFVHPSTYRPFEPEDIAELFNADEPFLPLELEGGGVTLIAKDRVAEVALVDDDEIADEPSGEVALPKVQVEVFLTGGGVRTGSVHLEARPGRARVLDYLNHLTTRFLTLYTANNARLLNRSLIDRISTLD
jgi:hypothetical protein